MRTNANVDVAFYMTSELWLEGSTYEIFIEWHLALLLLLNYMEVWQNVIFRIRPTTCWIIKNFPPNNLYDEEEFVRV